MENDEKPRNPRRLWKWTRRFIVTLFGLLVLLICAIFIYAAVVNHEGKEAIESAIAEVHARGLPLNREQIYNTAATGDDDAGHLYLAAFELAQGGKGKYDDLPYIGSKGKIPPIRKPLDPDLIKKIRAFAEENKRYFALLEEAHSRHARIPLLDFNSWQGPQLSHLSSPRAAARRWLILSMLAQAEGKDAEAVQDCAKAIETNRVFDGQPLIITGLVRAAISALVVGEIEATLSRTTPDPKGLMDLRSILLAEDAAIDIREILKGELAITVEVSADPDIAKGMETYSAVYAYRISEHFADYWKNTFPDFPADIPWQGPSISRSKLRFLLGVSWLWHWMCPGATQATHAHEIRKCLADYDAAGATLAEQARRAKRLTETGEMKEGGLSPLGVQGLLQGKAYLRAAAVALSVEAWRIRHQDWPEKLADVAASLPADPFTGEPMKYKRTNEGCVIYSVGKNLQDDGGKGYDNDGDDILFRLFDVEKRNKP